MEEAATDEWERKKIAKAKMEMKKLEVSIQIPAIIHFSMDR